MAWKKELNNYVVKLILQQLINSFDLQLLLLLSFLSFEQLAVKSNLFYCHTSKKYVVNGM